MKLKLFTPDPEKAKPAVKEAEQYLTDFGLSIRVIRFPLDFNDYREEYMDGMWGIDRYFMGRWINKDIFKSDAVLFHAPSFKRKGALGWLTRINSYPVMQAFTSYTETRGWINNIRLTLAEVIVHEVIHEKYRRNSLTDNTHKWMETGDFTPAIKEILEKTRFERWVAQFALWFMKPELEMMPNNWIVHHSGNNNDTVTGIRRYHKQKYGRTFYNYLIDRQGRIYHEHDSKNIRGGGYSFDVCLLGDFTTENPTAAQVKTLKTFLRGKPWITHKKASELMLATRSECPGNLEKVINRTI